MQHLPLIFSILLTAAHVTAVICVAVRVIMQRPPISTALAWLLLVAGLPGWGVAMYLLIGERRIGQRRARRIARLRTDYAEIGDAAIRELLTAVEWSRHVPAAQAMDTLGKSSSAFPTVCGSRFELFSDTAEILSRLAKDIEMAKKSLLMEFYIWNEGGLAEEVLTAIINASNRGVKCRILVDGLGGRPWWKGNQPAQLREVGVEVLPALPVGLYRMLFNRTDLRLHRKIVVIDGTIAWTGSMNLVDPRFFKQDSGVGEWVDAMARLQGSVVSPLAATMMGDWMLETGESIHDLIADSELHWVEPDGNTDIQVIPSGPGESADTLLQMMLALINAATEELILTTPYFVPDESLLRAIRGAAGRGVSVSLILPEKVDSLLTRYASRSYYDDLIDVGVTIYLYRDGLLHTKSVTADGKLAMFGTVNLDMRSLWLNYEVSLFVYGEEFSTALVELQRQYIAESDRLDPEEWARRSFAKRFTENTLRLVSPLL
jgi:cardiolipin synthase